MKRISTARSACIIALVVIAITIPLSINPVSAAADISYNWELPADGSNDTAAYYSVDRNDTSAVGYVNLTADTGDYSINIEFVNVENATLYLNETDFNINQYIDYMDWIGKDITITITGDVSTMNFTIHSIPEFAEATLDGSSWSSYTYSDNTLSFSLSMSSHTIVLEYADYIASFTSSIIAIVFLGVIVKMFKKIKV